MRLLIVEDSPSQAARLQSTLESEGYEVCVAVRGDQVFPLIEKEEPDLVILDLKLPDRDGFELCGDIKAAAGDRFLPVVMLTVLADVDNRVKGFDFGADDYIVKPYDPAELIARVAAMLRIRSHNEKALIRSVTDSLTGLYNRRFVEQRLREELRSSRRTGLPVACVLLDVDHFKAVNDNHGHAAGDRVLKELAHIFSREKRREDVVARYGGEEFLLVLRACDIESARIVADRLRQACQDCDWRAAGVPQEIAVSAGVVAFPHPLADASVAIMISAADSAMYEAKRQGRNRICLYTPPSG